MVMVSQDRIHCIIYQVLDPPQSPKLPENTEEGLKERIALACVEQAYNSYQTIKTSGRNNFTFTDALRMRESAFKRQRIHRIILRC